MRSFTYLPIDVEPLVRVDGDANFPRVGIWKPRKEPTPQIIQDSRLVQMVERAHVLHSLPIGGLGILRPSGNEANAGVCMYRSLVNAGMMVCQI